MSNTRANLRFQCPVVLGLGSAVTMRVSHAHRRYSLMMTERFAVRQVSDVKSSTKNMPKFYGGTIMSVACVDIFRLQSHRLEA